MIWRRFDKKKKKKKVIVRLHYAEVEHRGPSSGVCSASNAGFSISWWVLQENMVG